MTTTDYVLDLALIGIVLLQIRGRRLSLRALLIPLVIVGWALSQYLHGIPTAGNDLVLVVLATALGVGLGMGSGLLTHVRRGTDGGLISKASAAAAVLWVLGVGTRFAFQLYASHGGGGAIARFSVTHQITSNEAWVAALLLMALGEALSRTAVVALRAYRIDPSVFTPKGHRSANMGPRWAIDDREASF